MAAAAEEAGSALSKAFKRKVQGAAEACQGQGLVFLPIALETKSQWRIGGREVANRRKGEEQI